MSHDRPTLARRMLAMVRTQVVRLVVAIGLAVILPAVAVAERIRRGSGRVVAREGASVVGRLCGVKFEVRGGDRLDKGCSYVFVPNHSSPLDIPAMLIARPDVCFLAAAELFRIPLLAAAMRALSSVPIDRRDTALAHRQLTELAALCQPLCLTVFAEGGIPPAGERRPFKRGAFALAIETGATVVPVAIRHSSDVLPPGQFLAVRPGTVIVEFLEPILTAHLTAEDCHMLRDRVRNAVISSLRGDACHAMAGVG